MTDKMKAVIYLRTQQARPSDEELDRLTALRNFAQLADYEVAGMVSVCDPFDGADLPVESEQVMRKLVDGEIDVIVLWREDRDVPSTVTRDDIFTPDRDLDGR